MAGVKLKESLDPVNDGLNPSGRPNPKLERGEQARESARREEAEGESRGSTKENLRNGNRPNTTVLLLGRDEPAREEPGAGGRINATTGNILKEKSNGEKEERVFC